MATRIQLRGVPKTFTTKAAALRFLRNSPGYRERQAEYLKTYWPGLVAELGGNAPASSSSRVQAPNTQTLRPAKPKRMTKAEEQKVVAEVTANAALRGMGPVLRQSATAAPSAFVSGVNLLGPNLYRKLGGDSPAPGIPEKGSAGWAAVEALGILPFGRPLRGARAATKGVIAAGKAARAGEDVRLAAEAAAKAAYTGPSVVSKGASAAKARKAATAAADVPPPRPPRLPPTATAGPPAPHPPGGGPKTLNETVQEAFSGVDEAIVAKNALNSQERAARATGAMKAYYDAGGGSAGIAAARGELRGAFPTVDWNGFTELSPETLDVMIRSVADNPEFGFYDMLHVSEGLERAVSGANVQQHQLTAIRRAFGAGVADALANPANRTFWRRLYDGGVKIWNIPRATMASFDLSAPFRQVFVGGSRHPVVFAKNFRPMVKSFGSERVTRELAEEIPTRANFQRYGIGKLKFTDMLGMREEQWPGSYVDNVVGIKNSARAYSTFLNKMRADMFDHLVDVAAAHGKNIDDPKFLTSLGEHVMNATGRGKIPGGEAGENAATFLNQFLFSPRLLASRFQILNPVYYARLAKTDPFVARQAAQSLATTLGGISAMVYLASNIPGAKVGLNPLSADFGKVRIGDTRLDFAAGFQPLIVLYSRWYKNEYVSSSTGEKTELGSGYGIPMRGDLFLRFMESKMAPSPRLVWDLANGENMVGEPMTPRSVAAGMAPLNLQGAWEAGAQEGVPMGVAAGALGSIGFGANTYPDKVATPTVSSSTSSRRPSSSSRRSSSKPSRRRSSTSSKP